MTNTTNELILMTVWVQEGVERDKSHFYAEEITIIFYKYLELANEVKINLLLSII